MAVQSFKELIAWQRAMDLVAEVYRVTATFPPDERFGLTIQIRRAAVAVPSNIAEGQGRGAGNEFVRFLTIARGSLQEVDTQLLLAVRLGFLSQERYDGVEIHLVNTAKLINGLIRSLPNTNW